MLWRAALPGIFDALRLCNGWAWTYLVVAELVAANEGLGYRILKFSRFLQTPKIWVYLILLGVIGLGLDVLFRAAQPAALPLGGDEQAMKLEVRQLAKTYAGRRAATSSRSRRPRSPSTAASSSACSGRPAAASPPPCSLIAGLEEPSAGEVFLDGAARQRARARARHGVPELHALPLAHRRREHALLRRAARRTRSAQRARPAAATSSARDVAARAHGPQGLPRAPTRASSAAG